jgi:O-antigen/teichoic acid export membrane protein
VSLRLPEAGSQLSYAMPIALCGMFYELTQVVDKYLISYYLGPEQFAIYSVGCYEIPLLVIVFQSIADVLLPRAVEMKRVGDIEGVIQTWHSGAELSFIFAWPLFAFMFFFADDIIPVLFTSTYASSVPVFRITMFNVLIAATRYGLITRVFAKTWFDFAATLVSFFIMLPFCIYGVQHYGLVGAALALILGKVLNATFQLVYANSLLKISCLHILPFRRVFSVGAISILLALGLDYASSGWTGLLPVKLGVLAVAYLILFGLVTNNLRYWSVDRMPLPGFMRDKLLLVFK